MLMDQLRTPCMGQGFEHHIPCLVGRTSGLRTAHAGSVRNSRDLCWDCKVLEHREVNKCNVRLLKASKILATNRVLCTRKAFPRSTRHYKAYISIPQSDLAPLLNVFR